jgi:mannose-6-phosphate isomerase-like protein (cupin superfamily)
MRIKEEDSIGKRNSATCFVREYPIKSKKLGFAVAEINGRYPEEGYSVNELCELVYYVISGFGTLNCDGDYYELNRGDLFFIKPKSKYWIEGKNLLIAIPSTPPFSPNQYKQVKE